MEWISTREDITKPAHIIAPTVEKVQSGYLDYPLPKQKKKNLHKLKTQQILLYMHAQIFTKEISFYAVHGYKNLLAQ